MTNKYLSPQTLIITGIVIVITGGFFLFNDWVGGSVLIHIGTLIQFSGGIKWLRIKSNSNQESTKSTFQRLIKLNIIMIALLFQGIGIWMNFWPYTHEIVSPNWDKIEEKTFHSKDFQLEYPSITRISKTTSSWNDGTASRTYNLSNDSNQIGKFYIKVGLNDSIIETKFEK